MLHNRAYGWQSAGQSFARPSCAICTITVPSPSRSRRSRWPTAITLQQPKAYYKKRFTIEDAEQPLICKPPHLLIAASRPTTPPIIVTRPSARDCKHLGADPRCRRALQQAAPDMHYQHVDFDRRRLLRAPDPWLNAGVGPEDIDITGSYDAFTFTTMLQLEDYGFCKKRGRNCRSSGAISRRKRPNNTSGGHPGEGPTA
jgi:hypothetical protein